MTEPLALAQQLQKIAEFMNHSMNEDGVIVGEAANEITRLRDANKALTAEKARLEDDLDEANRPVWPEWADQIRKCLVDYGVDPGDEWDLPAQFEDWLNGAVEAETARATAAEAKLAKVEAERDVAWHHTSNLLARIHRDGGHYEAEHGTSKAVEDADGIVASLYTDRDRLSAELAEARSRLRLVLDHPANSQALADARTFLASKEDGK